MSKQVCSSLSEKSVYFSLTASILLDTIALLCDTLIINKTNGGQYPGDKMERTELNEQVRIATNEYPDGKNFTVYGMVEFADVAGSTQGVWQWDGRYIPRIEGEENLSETSIAIIFEEALRQFAMWQEREDEKKLQRQEVIDIVGREAVETVESMNCEPTGGLGYCGSAHGDEYTEWCAWLRVDHADCDYVAVYYYTTNEEDEKIAEQDGSAINWTPERWLLV